MIAQARITSDTSATVHLPAGTVELEGEDLVEIRSRVKQVFITAAQEADAPVDVVIVEPDVHHHLRVEPSGRITGREADDRPFYGPSADTPLEAPSAAETTGQHAAIGSPATDEHPALDEDGSVRPTRAHRRRAAALPPAGDQDGEHTTASAADAPSPWAPAAARSAGSAGTAGSAASARSAVSAVSASSAAPAPSAASARPAAPAGAPAPAARPLPSVTAAAASRPTLQDLQSSTAKGVHVKAAQGWQGTLTKLTGGRISPRPGRKERLEHERLERIRRPLEGPRNIAVVNLKGGAHKTTASLMIAATLGVTRGGNVLAWDNNETRGTLGWRGVPTDHHRTVVDLLHDIERMQGPHASAADLDPYVRPQGGMRFDILASDEDPGSMASIDAEAFSELNDSLSRFYRIKVIDTGNNVRASNWLAAVENADQLVIVSTVREDTFNAAAWMIDELRATGLAGQVDHAVTILSHGSAGKFDPTLRKRLLAHFGAHTRAVVEVPFEKQFVDGSHLDWSRIHPRTKDAWLDATALIIDGL